MRREVLPHRCAAVGEVRVVEEALVRLRGQRGCRERAVAEVRAARQDGVRVVPARRPLGVRCTGDERLHCALVASGLGLAPAPHRGAGKVGVFRCGMHRAAGVRWRGVSGYVRQAQVNGVGHTSRHGRCRTDRTTTPRRRGGSGVACTRHLRQTRDTQPACMATAVLHGHVCHDFSNSAPCRVPPCRGGDLPPHVGQARTIDSPGPAYRYTPRRDAPRHASVWLDKPAAGLGDARGRSGIPTCLRRPLCHTHTLTGRAVNRHKPEPSLPWPSIHSTRQRWDTAAQGGQCTGVRVPKGWRSGPTD